MTENGRLLMLAFAGELLDDYLREVDAAQRQAIDLAVGQGAGLAVQLLAPRTQSEGWRVEVALVQSGSVLPLAGLGGHAPVTH